MLHLIHDWFMMRTINLVIGGHTSSLEYSSSGCQPKTMKVRMIMRVATPLAIATTASQMADFCCFTIFMAAYWPF